MSDWTINLSTVYADLPRDARPHAAATDGHTSVESWWDFDSPTPPDKELQGFVDALSSAGTRLTAINSYGGDRARGECGLACLPDRVDEFRDSIRSVATVAELTGATKSNVAFGPLVDSRGVKQEEQWDTAARNYEWAAGELADVGVTVLIEPLSLSGNGYPFHTGYDVRDFLASRLLGTANIGVLLDAFHLAANQLDPARVFRDIAPAVKHIQLADFPGRGAPGTGGLDFDSLLEAVHSLQYDGEIALEYFQPTSHSDTTTD